MLKKEILLELHFWGMYMIHLVKREISGDQRFILGMDLRYFGDCKDKVHFRLSKIIGIWRNNCARLKNFSLYL